MPRDQARNHGLGVAVAALLFLFAAFTPISTRAQVDDAGVRDLIQRWKQDPRGPYQAIRWFCPDGRVLPPAERCDDPKAIQHALPKDEVRRLETRHLFLGQILAGLEYPAFLDEGEHYARPIQYMLERYLERVDDGWIRRRARFYRGAVQAEDEEVWGKRFLAWLTRRDDLVRDRYFLVRELFRDIPHQASVSESARIRGLAAEISDAYPSFLDLRVKIHGQPSAEDRDRVGSFLRDHREKAPEIIRDRLEQLIALLTSYYERPVADEIQRSASLVPEGPTRASITDLAIRYRRGDRAAAVDSLGSLLLAIRDDIQTAAAPARPGLFDASLAMESLLFRLAAEVPAVTPVERFRRARSLAVAAAGAGWLEGWEWARLAPLVEPPDSGVDSIGAADYRRRLEDLRRVVEWGTGTAGASFGREITRFQSFEPLAGGFVDDRLRGSVLLRLGAEIDQLGAILAMSVPGANRVMDLASPDRVRGMNAGFAVGVLRVVPGNPDEVVFRTDEIYVLARPPSEMKPVAGVLSVTEGNVVSHVQLLARNLGIPNAVIAPDHIQPLAAFDGKRVFLAVSPRGVVRMIPSDEMSDEERALVEVRTRSEERIRVPTDRLALDHTELTLLNELRASDSGRLCGPKAANLGQLSSLFPDRVAPGFIVPFGVFRAHMEQDMPGQTGSYWSYLGATFEQARDMAAAGVTADSVDTWTLGRLALLRDAIAKMRFDPAFVAALKDRFGDAFGTRLGATPVFVRSDTNMEDLKDFTGAGLNQTVPNVVSERDVLDAIRRVWASPYRERSYGWRQRYLLNPQDVYPSILILKSVDVQYSGVMITTGIASGDPDDDTVAFNRGVGGAVDGQAAETWLLGQDGVDHLLAPAREPTFRSLPSAGGTRMNETAFSNMLLSDSRRAALRETARSIRELLPGTPGIETRGPFDIELGFFDEEVKLFQVRPFVENRNAASTGYLLGLDSTVNATSSFMIPLK